MKITLGLKLENYQIFQEFDENDKNSLTELLNNWVSSRYLFKKNTLENTTEQPIFYRKAGSAKGQIQFADDFDEPLNF